MTDQPRISVLMPAYNAGVYIAEAIRSVISQTFTDFELILVDDGSEDNTLAVAESFADSRIRIIRQKHAGVAQALNTGLAASAAKYIARFDADDICFPERLAVQYRFLEEDPTYELVGCDAEYISADGAHLFNFSCLSRSNEEIVESIHTRCPFIHSGVMYRREIVVALGGYDERAHHFEDHLLWVQLIRRARCCNLPVPLIRVRINPASATIDERWRGKKFARIKGEVIRRGSVTEEEGEMLLVIITQQDKQKMKQGSYHALCGKKYLANNYQPGKARWHVSRAIRANPLRWDNYAMLVVSFFPQGWIKWLHGKMPGKI